MLVLARREGAKVMVGDDIVVEVVRIRGDRVYLGFTAPIEVKIFREELIQAEREAGKTA